MSSVPDDKALEGFIGESLTRMANDTASVTPGFADQLAQMAQRHPQPRASVLKRVIEAFGGWSFAAPQLAGLITAAVLGVSTGQAQVADVDLTDQEAAIMTAHVFSNDDMAGWDQ
ncbi:MAG: hypothetical protein AAF221_06565 [Pseudomonadota bacterium]